MIPGPPSRGIFSLVSKSGTLILTNGTRLRMVRLNVSRRLSVVLTLAMSVSQAAEGEEAFTLVGSVK